MLKAHQFVPFFSFVREGKASQATALGLLLARGRCICEYEMISFKRKKHLYLLYHHFDDKNHMPDFFFSNVFIKTQRSQRIFLIELFCRQLQRSTKNKFARISSHDYTQKLLCSKKTRGFAEWQRWPEIWSTTYNDSCR